MQSLVIVHVGFNPLSLDADCLAAIDELLEEGDAALIDERHEMIRADQV